MPSRRPQKLIPSIIPKLMFGTTPLAYKGSTTKIHLLSEPAQIMLTKTFSIHPTDVMAYTSASTRRGSFSSNNSSGNNTTEISGLSTISGHGDYRSHPRASRPMTAFIPESAYTHDPSRNGHMSSSMPNASHIRPSRTARPGFDTRRLRRASQTSMENGTFNPTPLPSSFSHLDSLGNAKPALTQAARSKSFSIAVFIEVNNNTRLREFIFSHFALIESRLHHLQALCLELLLPVCRRMINAKAGLTGGGHVRSIPDLARLSFQQDPRLQEAVSRLQQAIYQLYSAPRIQSPLWLNINTYPSKRSVYSASFMTELMHLMEESPASSQLVSEVISAVLSHHMSWVPTIAPADQSLIRANPQGAYDPLWAQLSDLYGNIGTSSRISRTIVVGSNGSFVRRLLHILSYFIRCNEVFLRLTEFQDDPDSLLNQPMPVRTTPNPGSATSLINGNGAKHPETGAAATATTVAKKNEEGDDKILPADVLFCKSYGRSLMAPYVDRYMSDFALMGVPKFDFQHFMETDMRDTMRHFETQERVASTVCIVADVNTMKCNVFCAKAPPPLPASVLDTSNDLRGGLSGGGGGVIDLRGEPVTRLPHASPSSFMDATLHQMLDLAHSGLSPELCLNYLEDRLLQVYQCSRLLSSLARDREMLQLYPTLESMAPLLGLHRSDMGLVLAVCSTYDDQILSAFDN
ncbi:Folliculin-interacting protein 1 [Mortierella alpina]|nr:Folliculin-interacting protein 1 [Mortierella alpina]